MINYDEIDELCIPIVKFFNSIGLTTKFSCQGHDEINRNFYIIFDENILDTQIQEFLEKISNGKNYTPLCGHFYKWIRKCDNMICNWIYQVDSSNFYLLNQIIANEDFETMKKNIKK